jgi:hypothetical protein
MKLVGETIAWEFKTMWGMLQLMCTMKMIVIATAVYHPILHLLLLHHHSYSLIATIVSGRGERRHLLSRNN